MTVNSQRLLLAAAGAGGAAGDALYVDDVFSCFLYEGNGSSQTITNGIDLDGEGGMVWGGHRGGTSIGNLDRFIYDTERGVEKAIYPSSTSGEVNDDNGISAFNSDGFSLPSGNARHNDNGYDYVSWTFRKAPGFFDVVTYTGTGSATTIAHNLGSVPGCIMVKRLDGGAHWQVFHRSLGNTKYLQLNQDNAAETSSLRWNDTDPTSTVFTVGTNSSVNGSGSTYVAYLFAHDDQSFGTDSDEAIIKCDSYTGNGTSGNEINVGFEPQWLMIKRTSGSQNWFMFDNMRGIATGGNDAYVQANTTTDEQTADDLVDLTATGFKLKKTNTTVNGNGSTYIYVAIRRPHKPPEAASGVFGVLTASNEPSNTGGGGEVTSASGVLADLILHRPRKTSGGDLKVCDRLRGDDIHLETTTSGAEADASGTFGGFWKFDRNENAYIPGPGLFNNTTSNTPYVVYSYTRAPGFFDAVAYDGSASNQAISHNLGAVPEFMILKKRDEASDWTCYHSAIGNTKSIMLHEANAQTHGRWNSTSPTATNFTVVGDLSHVNESGRTYIAYLFASLSGVSKVGSYTGTGSNIGVDCGFTAGARFVLIKRYDSGGSWYYWDTARGIVGGNDPYLLTNSTAAEVTNTDYIDPLNSGFTVTSSAPADLNASGGSYLFLAIA